MRAAVGACGPLLNRNAVLLSRLRAGGIALVSLQFALLRSAALRFVLVYAASARFVL
mgnify:CR=1 FL=1